ncbi:GNAT family N-acetyltransferase [Streptomyces sp. TRM43335]|uniref:GNAT family N-acetyltransferase n=1 Tax=Streptomyces taklimakanensis TaxID=2569853 RepID=A0A6G2BAM4_9ACTN|nr:GNAT family N-acetyltransferase [Streptomyces taklimakanensis]MTE19274.1 GNAT family N-acetyltransferase [Streptomyces taklimakanensis]
MRPVTLGTARLVLRPFTPEDVPAVHSACQDPDILRWTTLPEPYERRHAQEFVLSLAPSGWREDTAYNFGVFTRDGGELVGSMGLVRITPPGPEGRVAELGYWTARERRRHGYTAEAAGAVVDWAFDELGVERLEWVAEVGNTGSRAVAERLGFVVEGTLRARIPFRGTRRDAWLASLLPSDRGRTPGVPHLPAT